MSDHPTEPEAAKTLFISRAGADAAFAAEIGRVLEAAGYRVVLQQWDFANRNFIERIHQTLAGGARVVGLLSPEYLQANYCAAEWQNALAGDPLNTKGRLILLRVAECEPVGLLAGIAYWDLVPVRDNPQLLESILRDAVAEGRRMSAPLPGPYWRAPRTVLDHEAIRPTPSFTGRDEEFAALSAVFAADDRAGDPVAMIHGLGGIGKSSLAREYAWRNREHYAVVWWLNAESESGIVESLLRLGGLFVRSLDQLEDRRAAAQQVITTVFSGFSKPVLLVFDNLEDEGLLRTWRPRMGAHVLATSRIAAWGDEVEVLPLHTWSREEAVAYLGRGSGRSDLTAADALALAEALGGLPLALAHAAAYLRATKTVTPQRYLKRIALQMAAAPRSAEYPRSVFATFQTAIAEAESQAPGAVALLSFAAGFAPDLIPDELFHQNAELYAKGLAPVLPGSAPALDLRTAVSDSLSVDEALGALDRLSLMTFSPSTMTFSLHRLVQLAARDMVREAASAWTGCAIAALDAAFPEVEFSKWPQCERLVPHVRAALDSLRQDFGSADAGRLAYRCGMYLLHRGAYVEAEPVLARSVEILENTLGPNDPETATSLHDLAFLYREQARYTEAEPLHVRSLEIRENALGPEHPDTATSLNNLAGQYRDQGRYAEAEPLFLRSLAIREKTLSADHPATAMSLNDLAILYKNQGRDSEAERLFVRASVIYEKAFGPNHPETARSLNNLAVLYRDQARYTEAERLQARALEIFEHALGPEHPHTAASCSGLAVLYRNQGRYSEAERLFERALAVREKALGADHPRTAETLHETARLFALLDRPEEAEAFFARALGIRERAFGSEHALTDSTRREISALHAHRSTS